MDAVEEGRGRCSSRLQGLKTLATNVTALMDTSTGRLDAVVVDEVVGRYYVAKKPPGLRGSGSQLGTEDYGVGVRQDDTELQAQARQGPG